MSVSTARTRTAELAAYVAGASFDALPATAVERAEQLILDTLGAMISGVHLPPAQGFRPFAAAHAGAGACTVFGSEVRADPVSAAFANAVAAHADETDDSHLASLTHPAAATVPAALALGEHRGADGATAIAAVVAGYDVQCRVSLALDPRDIMDRGFMPLAICAGFGAAASAAVMLGLDEDQTAAALGLAGLQAGGLWACAEDSTHLAKALMAGAPVRNGVTAALLAAQGCQGPPDIFEGRDGVLAAFSSRPSPGELTAELGERFEILRTSIKKHACGGPIRGAVDGVLEILATEGLVAADIDGVRVRIAPSACAIVDGRDDLAINLQHVVAVAAIDGVVGVVQTHSPARTRAADVQALRRRVALEPEPAFEPLWPAQRPTLIELRTTAGARHERRVEHPRGTPENPLTWDEVRAKFAALGGSAAIAERVRRLAELHDVRTLLADV
jgi:2-methylcitrate dehydratase PrpD